MEQNYLLWRDNYFNYFSISQLIEILPGTYISWPFYQLVKSVGMCAPDFV